jgi:hypothetical protein
MPVESTGQALRRAAANVLVGTELACPPTIRKLPSGVSPFPLVIGVEGDLLVPRLKLISVASCVTQGRKEARQRGKVISQRARPLGSSRGHATQRRFVTFHPVTQGY